MAYPESRGQKNKVLNTGRSPYGGDGTDFWPLKVVVLSGGTEGELVIAQREAFEFRPGQSALGSGAVAAGSRTSSGTITTGGTADSTYWGTDVVYQPARAGLIDGKSTNGIIWGQVTVGLKTGAATADAKVTARIKNGTTTSSGTAATFLGLTAAIACTTAEIFRTYDLNYLQTDANFNAIPFSMAIGVQSNLAATTIIGRIMESSGIYGEFEAGT